MRSSVALLAVGTVSAQSTVTLINPFQAAETLTINGSESGTTTYFNPCTGTRNSSRPSLFKSSTLAPPATFTDFFSTNAPVPTDATSFPTAGTALPTPKPRVRRDDDENEDFCEGPYTIIQGPSTWQFHLTDSDPGAWTVDANCNWEGASTAADLTCTASQSGSFVTGDKVSTTVWKASDLSSFGGYQTVVVVSASTTGSVAASATASQSSGIAPPMPFPTGAMALVGGAAGLFAAAIAL
ncbi:hypothetical protein BDV96DRAFT_648684 [Lophiotrema nucula]|uniref:Uncharacterized protein n=1 Tax=Lophiotrema nucula TaxID=690887 RepID=A0A6A5Z3S9_9PLEO|nr:hypothetical protein BDV96DRAFT_648684 [Lophiotrema nucula]